MLICLAQLVFCHNASKSLWGVVSAILIGIWFFISLDVRRRISSAGHYSFSWGFKCVRHQKRSSFPLINQQIGVILEELHNVSDKSVFEDRIFKPFEAVSHVKGYYMFCHRGPMCYCCILITFVPERRISLQWRQIFISSYSISTFPP